MAASGLVLGFRPPRSHASGGGEFAAGTGGTARGPVVAAAAPGVGGPRARWVVAENALAGTDDWRIADPGKRGDIEGYAGAVSVQRGDTVILYVSTRAAHFHVEGYRM